MQTVWLRCTAVTSIPRNELLYPAAVGLIVTRGAAADERRLRGADARHLARRGPPQADQLAGPPGGHLVGPAIAAYAPLNSFCRKLDHKWLERCFSGKVDARLLFAVDGLIDFAAVGLLQSGGTVKNIVIRLPQSRSSRKPAVAILPPTKSP